MLPAGSPSPFTIICSASTGAINTASLAAKSDDIRTMIAERAHE